MIARVSRPGFGRCGCNPCEHRCEVKQLREENARLRSIVLKHEREGQPHEDPRRTTYVVELERQLAGLCEELGPEFNAALRRRRIREEGA